MSETSPRLSVVINTKNSATTLSGTLASVRFADEIIVVDMHSSDETVKLAKQAGAQVFTHDDVGYVEPARNFALEKTSGEWVLVVDADETVPSQLAEKLRALMVENEAADIYWLPRLNTIFGQAITHTGWWPDYQLRFFKAGHVTWTDQIHQPPHTKGSADYLPADPALALQHANYFTVTEFVARLNRYTDIEAERQSKNQTSSHLLGAQLVQAWSDEFFRRYFDQLGYKDGAHGAALSWLQSWYPVVQTLKRWQLTGFTKSDDVTAETESMVSALEKFNRDLTYWTAHYRFQHGPSWQKPWWWFRMKFR